MNNVWVWIAIVVVVLVGGFIWWQNMQAPAPSTNAQVIGGSADYTPQGSNTNSPDTSGASVGVDANAGASAGAPMSTTVTYTAQGFSPSEVTIKKGGTVTFVNQSGGGMWVASGSHPAHTGYDATDRTTHCASGYANPAPFDQCKSEASYSFTFEKVGTWPYHDHLNSSKFGKVIVVE